MEVLFGNDIRTIILSLCGIFIAHSILFSFQIQESVLIPVVANGDIKTESDVIKVHEKTGVNGKFFNFCMHIFHVVLYTFPKVLTRRIYVTIKSFFCW